MVNEITYKDIEINKLKSFFLVKKVLLKQMERMTDPGEEKRVKNI